VKTIHVPVNRATRHRAEAKGHDVLQKLLAMSPEETDAWLAANVHTMGDAHKVLAAFAAALRHLHP